MPTRKYNKVKKSKKSKKMNKSKRRKNKTKHTRKRIKGGSSGKKKRGKRKIYSKGGGLLQSKVIELEQEQEQEQEPPECSICQDLIDNDNITIPCGHSFHINCLLEWCRRHNMATTCPLCREPIPDICAELLPDIIPDVEVEPTPPQFPPPLPFPDIVTTTDTLRVSPRASPLTITDLNLETYLLPQTETVAHRVRNGFFT